MSYQLVLYHVLVLILEVHSDEDNSTWLLLLGCMSYIRWHFLVQTALFLGQTANTSSLQEK
jgi:hypothetical protein